MRLNVMLEPQEGLTYTDQLAVARRAEELSFDGFYRSDHYSSVAGRGGTPSTDAWAVLAGSPGTRTASRWGRSSAR